MTPQEQDIDVTFTPWKWGGVTVTVVHRPTQICASASWKTRSGATEPEMYAALLPLLCAKVVRATEESA
jgi:hypothetical protein